MRKSGFTIDERKNEVLAAIVKAHVTTGQPVGSFALARQSSERLSSATMRNICAELEEEGLLSHPHTSAGRIPTQQGYRYYVDHLMSSTMLSPSERDLINDRLLDDEILQNPELMMERASQLLSELSDNVGIVVPPAISQDRLHHIEFVKLPDKRVLVITASNLGRVQDRLIRFDEDFSQNDLNTTARYLLENFHGWSLAEIRDELLRRMTEEKALYDKLLRNAVVLCSQSLQDGDQPDVFIEGASSIITKPDFADVERMRVLFKMFEQKGRIVKMLNSCIAGARFDVATVRIGSENGLDLHDCAVIASPYFYGSGTASGSIGVVGPTRVDYDRVVSIVTYIANLFGRVLNENI
ncbi:MAG: heat-inducible transcriptional repressor HrcA [Acidobacteriota bacterium]